MDVIEQTVDTAAPSTEAHAVPDKKRYRGWKILGIYALSLFVLAALILVGWNFFLASYEKSSADREVKAFVDKFSDEGSLAALLTEYLSIENTVYESSDLLLRECYLPAALEGSVTYRKEYVKDLPENQLVYNVYLDGEKIFRLCLKSNEGEAGFFLDTWSIYDVKAYAEGFALEARYSYTLFVPEDATVTVNGCLADRDCTQQSVALCLFEEGGVTVDVYRIDGLHTPPTFEVREQNGEVLPYGAEGNFLFFSESADDFVHYTFTVPDGVEVLVNGILLDGSNCFSYEDTEYPGSVTSPYGMPETVLYRVDYFASAPSVTASYRGVELTPALQGTHYSFTYPEELLYTLEVEVPEGAAVTVNGVPLAAESGTTGPIHYRDLASYENRIDGEFPETTVYTVDALYVIPQVQVSLNGTVLNPDEQQTEGTQILYTYLSSPSETLKSEQETFVENFVRAYVNYVGMGKTNLSSNLSKVQGYTLYKSEAYRTLSGSYEELRWVTAYRDMEYQYLTTSDYVALSDTVYQCTAAFSVDVNRSGVTKHFESSLSILVICNKGSWKVVDFQYLA